MMKIHIFIALVLFWCLPARATTINAASCSQTDVQSAINSAVTGDTVLVSGPCTVAWASAVTIPNTKGITVQASGTVTITTNGFTLNQNATTTTRLTGFTFNDPGNNGSARALLINGSNSSANFRVDHNTFTNTAQSVFIGINGNAPGLLDHNIFSGGGASEMIHNLGLGGGGTSGWNDNLTPGSSLMIFIEDNTFTYSGGGAFFNATSAIQSYYSARTVIRHNTFNNSQIDQHGTAGNLGARWWEIYENTFNVTNLNQCCYMVLRAGSGVIFNNHQTGTNTTAGSIALLEEDTGYPALYQVGRGINQDYSPAYLWNNASTMPVVSQSSNVQANRDFFNSASQPPNLVRCELTADGGAPSGLIGTCPTTYSYTPFTYPHPLQGASSVAAPTGLAAVVN